MIVNAKLNAFLIVSYFLMGFTFKFKMLLSPCGIPYYIAFKVKVSDPICGL